jgi:hypothetical protein
MRNVRASGLVLTFVCFCFAASKIDSYLSEAQQRIGRPIHVTQMPESDPELGLTTVKVDEVVIQIRRGLTGEFEDDVLAHELGHVLLRSRGFHGGFRGITAGRQRNRTFMAEAAAIISNCYEDPLADAEAKKHGFHPERISDHIAVEVERKATPTGIKVMMQQDELWPNYESVYLYCLELRPHTFKEEQLERKFASEPRIQQAKRVLTEDLGTSPCQTSEDCFEREKRLRDWAGFRGLITIVNPKTGQEE